VYNLCRVKTDILAVLTVKSGLNSHLIIKLKYDLNRCSLFIYLFIYIVDYLPLIFHLRVGIYLVNTCLIKVDQLKMLSVVKPCQLFLYYSLACYIIYSTC
jgi:hypothetical protein